MLRIIPFLYDSKKGALDDAARTHGLVQDHSVLLDRLGQWYPAEIDESRTQTKVMSKKQQELLDKAEQNKRDMRQYMRMCKEEGLRPLTDADEVANPTWTGPAGKVDSGLARRNELLYPRTKPLPT